MSFEWQTCSNSSFIHIQLKQQTETADWCRVLLVILQTGMWTTTFTFTRLQFWGTSHLMRKHKS
jgi:hypothetical protein